MDMTGEYRIPATRERVWAALNDPTVLQQCIPGCESLEKKSETEYAATVMAKVGPVKARFSGKLTLSDMDPPNGCTMSGEGTGGVAGFGKGGAKVALAETDGATLLSYTAHAQVGGKLAQLGSRLIDTTARKMADDFFGKFTALIGGPAAATADTTAPASPPEASAAAAPSGERAAVPSSRRGLSVEFWIGAAVGALLGIILYHLLS